MIALRWNVAQAFERLWWQNYLSGKDGRQYLDWKKKYWDGMLEQVFSLVSLTHKENFRHQSLHILDAGCGPSGIFLNLSHQRVDALDPLINRYLEQHQLVKQSDYPNVRFIQGKLEDFSRQESYDYIFCMNCINHVNDIERCLENMFAALKHQGFLILTVDAHKFEPMNALLKLVPADILHPYQWNLEQYIRLVGEQFGSVPKHCLVKKGALFDHYLLAVQKKI